MLHANAICAVVSKKQFHTNHNTIPFYYDFDHIYIIVIYMSLKTL